MRKYYVKTVILSLKELSSRCFVLVSIIIDVQAAINLTGALFALVMSIML